MKVASQSPTGRDNDEQNVAEDDSSMGVIDHLRELRKRIVLSVLGTIPAFGLAWMYKERALEWLLSPFANEYRRLQLGEPSIHFGSPAGIFIAYLKMSIVFGLIIASPWIFWQVWKFVAPGLYKKEKRYALPFVLASTLCFAGGAFFGYEYIFPLCFRFFLEMAGNLPTGNIKVEPTIMVGEYLSMANGMLLSFGGVFELPVIVTFLAMIELVTWRDLIKFGRWWIVIAGFVSAIITPADPWSMIAVLIPLVALYYFSVGLAFIFGKRPGKKIAKT